MSTKFWTKSSWPKINANAHIHSYICTLFLLWMRDVCTLLPGFAIVILLKPNNSHLQSTKVYKCMHVSGHAMNSEDFCICCNLVSGDAVHMAANWPDYLLSCKYVKFLQFHNCAAHLGTTVYIFLKFAPFVVFMRSALVLIGTFV